MVKTFISFLVACIGFSTLQAQEVTMRAERIQAVPFTDVRFSDAFWAPRIETNRSVSIPSAFRESEKSGRFDNFALAAGLIEGEHKGDFSFDDTDPYKIIEGASYALAVQYDPRLDAYLDSVINLIARAQEPDGYLCTCVTNKCHRLSGWWGRSRWEKINSHELYNCGHLYEAAVAHYRATGKTSLLNIAIRNADLVCKVFGPHEGQIHRPSGHPIVEMALCKLYEVVGKKEYLETARYFVEETGRGTDGHRLNAYSQDHMPIMQQEEIVGHAVRAGYLYSGVADVASHLNDTAYFRALLRVWNNMVTQKLYITGGIGSRAQGEGFGPGYELHNHTAYCETCASIANVYWNHRMFLSTGDSRFIDVLERALYNGVPSGVSLSGDKFFYDNPLESMGQHERQKWFGCACCPGNVTRFMASVPGYAYAVSGRDVFVNLYIKGEAKIANTQLSLTLEQHTEMPWEGGTELVVRSARRQKFAMHIRIPAWLTDEVLKGSDLYRYADKGADFVVRVTGKEQKCTMHNGYLVVERRWKDGDKVQFDFQLNVRRVYAHEAVADDRGKAALQRGPIVYCVEGQDVPDKQVFNKYLSESSAIRTEHHAEMLGGVSVLRFDVQRVADEGAIEPTEVKQEVCAVPYCVWNNRERGEMAVWIPVSAQRAHPLPKETLTSRARSVMIKAPIQKDAPVSASTEEWAWGVNDGWEPMASDDTSKPYHYWWLKYGTQETLAYTFDKPEQISAVEVYWLDFDHYDGNFRVPEWWKLYYKDADQWKEVPNATSYGTEKDKYNRVSFTPLTTTALKMEVQLQKGQSGGVLEWKLYE